MRDTVEGDSVWEQRASSKVMEDIVGGMRDSNRDCVKSAEGLRESSRVQRDSVVGFRDSKSAFDPFSLPDSTLMLCEPNSG